MRSSRGFTLIELLTTITVLAIVMSFAAPGFTELIRSNRAQSQSSAIAAAFNLARSEAVKRGRVVSVVAPAAGTWALGWTVGVDGNNDNDFADTGELLIRAFPALTGSGLALVGKSYTTSGTTISRNSSANVAVIRFDAQGRALASDGARIAGGAGRVFEFSMGSNYCSLGRDIFVNHLGRVSIQRKVCQ